MYICNRAQAQSCIILLFQNLVELRHVAHGDESDTPPDTGVPGEKSRVPDGVGGGAESQKKVESLHRVHQQEAWHGSRGALHQGQFQSGE